MARSRPFAQVDVFSSEPYLGNPVAVILDGESLSDDEMQRIAQWTNLSETTFVLPPTRDGADYRLRIFTPSSELPFAGHPTLGSARAWLEHGGVPGTRGRIVQECGAGLVDVRVDDERLAFAAPPLVKSGPLEDEFFERLVAAFGVDRERVLGHQWVDNGPGWAALHLASADDVLGLEPDFSQIPDAVVGAVGAYPEGSGHAFEIRAFVPGESVPEDPVTGSLNASVAQWLTSTGQAPDRYTVSQGRALGRAGEISIAVEDDTVWVGGAATVLFSGTALA
ncbi:PhzF family phenazine biosynthesis protein [uncultured Agrococcus sp.]|uniref:PhzF family phenazine biosynthesis protein n=1 Tax=uncultured Agrococcus sp. TaxID=382258 RepID=UPI0025D9641A|nr:PhzF family phenazine biosynthesis protein [uncultured Agrococcus sp.]